ncbi:peptidase M54 [Thermococcus sp. P6]|uniref:peptidase M54 n=1 Tax=Thermococcus sp. P6 TaxID=122420 RepID=UPI000B5A15AE|nr:peptidase M54 [Thermococcus sp. P6]ASJ11239.1 peptidase M54 [Thermococcus sp. P6]
MEFIAFTYTENFTENGPVKEVIFDVFEMVNHFFKENDLPIRFVYVGKMKLEPGYLITIRTPEGNVRAYPLEVLVEVLHARLLNKIENTGIRMSRIFALTAFPLVSRNPYFDFYEKFLGIQETILKLRVMLLSIKPFEPPGLSELLRRAGSGNLSKEERELMGRKLRLFKNRLVKGVLHEVGHGFGLSHCNNNCVMNPPSSMEEWDSRMLGYCDSCFIDLKRAVEWSGR